MDNNQFNTVSRRKRTAKQMEVDGEVDIEKILDAEMKVAEPKMPQFKATKEMTTANQVCFRLNFQFLIALNCSKKCVEYLFLHIGILP